MKEHLVIPVTINQIILKKHHKKIIKFKVIAIKLTEKGVKIHLKYKDEFGDLSVIKIPLNDIYNFYYDKHTKIAKHSDNKTSITFTLNGNYDPSVTKNPPKPRY